MDTRRFRTMRLTGLAVAGALGAALVAGAPADAAPADGTTTIRGQLTTRAGGPIAGIRVTAGPYEGSADRFGSATTSASGRYVLHVAAGSVLYMSFTDPRHRYFDVEKGRFSARAGTTHRVDRVLARVSQIAGTVRDAAGRPIRQVAVHAYDVATGERSARTARSDRKGRFHLLIESGRYKLRFSGAGVRAEWFGDASTRAASPTVAVADGAKRSGTDAVLG